MKKEPTTQTTAEREAEFKRLEERTRVALITAATKALEHTSTRKKTRKQREIARRAEAILKRLKKEGET